MKIRNYKQQEKQELIGLLRLNTPLYFSPNEEKDFAFYLDNHAANYFVVEEDNCIIGCGGFNLSENGTTAKIAWDIIHPYSQRRGIGSKLINFRVNKIKENRNVKILSVRTSQLTYKFYEKFGLEIREVVKDFWDIGFDMYRLDGEIRKYIIPPGV